MEFRALGPLEVADRGKALPLGGGRQRALLAVLLLHAGQTVSTDRLIDELWGADPPGSALNSVHVYVSQLRKTLGDGRIVTRGHGYALEVGEDELDVRRFERLFREGRELLSKDPREASSTLSVALACWRGPALAEFASEEFAQDEIRRLEELRLAALEEKNEAELALGGAARLVSELETLVAANPLRERLRGQLMLALYRSGRQADALAAYREGRRRLVEELGLEPGPELRDLETAILNQDPVLQASAPAAERESRRRRGRLIAAGAAALLAASVAVAVVELTGSGGHAGLTAIPPNSLGAMDPASLKITEAVPVPGGPRKLAVRGGSIWAETGETLVELAGPDHRIAHVIPLGATASDVAAGDGATWVVSRMTGQLEKIDQAYASVVSRTTITPTAFLTNLALNDPWRVAAGAGAVWVTDGTSQLRRIDPATGHVRAVDLRIPVGAVAATEDSVWAAASSAATAVRLDPRTGSVTARVQIVSRPGLESPFPIDVAVGAGFLWVLNANTATVTKIDPDQRGVVATVSLGVDRDPLALAAGEGAAWVANGDGTLARIDPETNAVTAIHVGGEARDISVGGGRVWVAIGRPRGLARPDTRAAPRRVQALPAALCSPIYFGGGGTPQFLLASDLPLQGPFRSLSRPIAEAITFVLQSHGFKAGPYTLGYQACGETTPQDVISEEKCAANGRAYVANPSVLGIIGPFLSACARVEIPMLNRAPGGPLGLISPSNTYVGLTRHSPDTQPNEPAVYYPTGRRNYVRVIAADDIQAAADAILARRTGLRRMYVVSNLDTYGAGISSAFRRAARHLGLRIVGLDSYPDSIDYGPLVARIAHTRPDGVFLAGSLQDGGVIRFLRTLRAGLGTRVQIMTSDGFAPASDLVAALGPAAEGITVSVAGVPNERLGPAGRRFVQSFERSVGEPPVEFVAAAAQAAEILLEAIARSDGTRSSVTANLLQAQVSNGILGSFRFTPAGDTTAPHVTIYRILRGKPTVAAVLKPPASLVKP